MNSRQSYRSLVWETMHGRNCENPDTETAAIQLYMDESGDESPSTPHAVIGGMLIHKSHYLPFEAEWDQMLDRHGIAAPLHMKEFGPHGRFANIGKVCRHELIAEAAQLIITHRIFSIGATISNEEYKACVDKRLRERWSLYGMCFMLAATINHNLAEQNDYKEKIPFMLDNGNPHRPHIHQAYDQLIDLQKTGVSFNAGTLTFGDDADFGVLQAADLIAWGVRRRLSGNPFLKWFEPITEILDEAKGHAQQQWKEHWLKVFSNHLQEVESELLNPPNSP